MKFNSILMREFCMTKCPQCGYERKEIDSIISDAECPKCGIFYHKWKPPIVSENDEPIKKSLKLPLPHNSQLTIAREETYEDSGWVNFINILALLLIIDSTINLVRFSMGISGVFANPNYPLPNRIKFIYDFLASGILFFSAFGLFLRMKWARITVIVVLSLSLAEGLYKIVDLYSAINAVEKNMHESYADFKRAILYKLIPCLLCAYFIFKLSLRKVGSRFRSGIWKPSTISESKKSIKEDKVDIESPQNKTLLTARTKIVLTVIIVLFCIIGATFAIKQFIQKNAGQTVAAGQAVQPLAAGRAVQAVTAGGLHTLALSNEGIVWAWGDNQSGQLGDGTRGTMRSFPLPVEGLSKVISIAAGSQFSVALKSDGTVWTWGDNEFGQLGNGSDYVNMVHPVKVANLEGIIAIAAGDKHVVALKNDGSVWAWGNNSLGELGDGTKKTAIPLSEYLTLRM